MAIITKWQTVGIKNWWGKINPCKIKDFSKNTECKWCDFALCQSGWYLHMYSQVQITNIININITEVIVFSYKIVTFINYYYHLTVHCMTCVIQGTLTCINDDLEVSNPFKARSIRHQMLTLPSNTWSCLFTWLNMSVEPTAQICVIILYLVMLIWLL